MPTLWSQTPTTFRHRCGVGVKLRLKQEGLLKNATQGKLDPQWTGPYIVTGFKGLSTVLLRIGITVRRVYINVVCPLLTEEQRDQTESTNWTSTLLHHETGPMGLTPEEMLEVQNDPLSVGQAASLCSE